MLLSALFRRFALIRPRARISAPRAPKRVEIGGNASPWLHKRSERQKFGFRRRGREKRALQIWLNSVKLARRRREAPESSPKVSHGPSKRKRSAGQHSLPGGSQARDRVSKSERRDLVEWSEERAFQTVDSIVVKCRGRRFSRDLLDLLYTYYDIMGERGLGKCHISGSTLSSLLKGARF